MKFGLKVHHTDLDSLMYIGPEALEFVVFERDLDGTWADNVNFNGPMAVHMPEKYLDGTLVDLGSPDEDERKRAVEIAKKTIDLSTRLKAGLLVCHPGGVYPTRKDIGISGLVDSLRQLKAYAGDRVAVTVENMPDVYWYQGEVWATSLFKDWKEIREVLNAASVGMCMDLCHAKLYCNSRHIDLNLYVTVLKHYIRHLHISDALGVSSEGLQIGDGEIDFKSLLTVLHDTDAILVPEILDGQKNNGAGFRMAKTRLVRLGYIREARG